MIKNIPPTTKDAAVQTESQAPDAGTVSQEASNQFSSLVHGKGKSELKEFSKSKRKVRQSINKIENKLSEQVGQTKTTEHQQLSGAKHLDKQSVEQQGKQTGEYAAKQAVGRQDKQAGQAKTDEHQKLSSSKQMDERPIQERKASAATGEQDKAFLSNQKTTADKDLPQSLDAFDIASMIAQSPAPSQNISPATQTAATPSAPLDLNQIVGQIADRILVSSPADNPSGMQEIRIHLKESVLPNTEVRIYRHAGSLQVEFVTTSRDSQMFVEQRQPDIQKVLGERLANETVHVSVQDGQQTQGGQGEGRSRQQYISPDQEDDKNT